MFGMLRELYADERGTTAIEYALIGTLVGVALIAAFQRFAAVTAVLYAVIEAMTTVM
jgi:Flp pilus assembly pilin Flp